MSKPIRFVVAQPDKVVAKGEATAVVLPTTIENLTVVNNRAPSIVLLKSGMVQILDSNMRPIEKYFVKGGVADVCDDKCSVSSEVVFSKKELKLEDMQVLLETALSDADRVFYQMIVDELLAFK